MDLTKLTVPELKRYATTHNIRIPTSYRKNEIVNLLQRSSSTNVLSSELDTQKLEELPKDILLSIMVELDYPTIKQLCSTNKKIKQICTDEYFWQQKYERDFSKNRLLPNKSWRYNYLLIYIKHNEKQVYSLLDEEGKTIVSMMTNNLELFTDLLFSIINEIYDDDNPLIFIQTQIFVTLSEFIKTTNSLIMSPFSGKIENIMDNFLRDNSDIILRDYYGLPERDTVTDLMKHYYPTPYLLILKHLADIYDNDHDVTLNTIDQYELDRYLKITIRFINYIQAHNLLPQIRSTMIDEDKLFNRHPSIDYNLFKRFISENYIIDNIFIQL